MSRAKPRFVPSVPTSVELDLELRAQLDAVRAVLARESGRRPTLKALMDRALREFVSRELGRVGAR